MTREEFHSKYRPHLLGILADCYAIRKMPPSEFGMEVDRHLSKVTALLTSMYNDLAPKEVPGNGVLATQALKRN